MGKRKAKGPASARDRAAKRLLKEFGLVLAGRADVARHAAGERFRGLAGWDAEEGPRWDNDANTLVVEAPLASLEGVAGLHFAQEVWMTQPTVFEYLVLGDRAFVRLAWDGTVSASPP